MNRTVRTTTALALATVSTLWVVALAQGMHRPGTAAPGSAMPMQGMMVTQTVDEASFLVHMLPHHREAVASAERLLEVTERPELIDLANAIVETQTEEIDAMEGWLDQWYPDVDRDVAYQPMMTDLGSASTEEIEHAFLEEMIFHHMMAVYEAQTLLANDLAEHEEVAGLARSIIDTQATEIQQMRSLLGDGFAGPLGMGVRPGTTAEGADGRRFPGPMSPGNMGLPGGFGMHDGMGMHGGMPGGAGMHDGMPGGAGMHGGELGGVIGAAEAERLARAFLAGQGDDVEELEVTGPTFTYQVVYRDGDQERTLSIDGRTGEVSVAPER